MLCDVLYEMHAKWSEGGGACRPSGEVRRGGVHRCMHPDADLASITDACLMVR